MNKLENLLDKAMATGNEIIKLKEAISREMQEATEAVTAAAAEMEKAAIDGNEAAYARAKEKRNSAENHLEVLQIRAKNRVTSTDADKEAALALVELQKESVSEIRKMIRDFCSKDAEIVRLVESIEESAKKYNQVVEYFRSYVLKDNDRKYTYMAELLPIHMIIDYKKHFAFQRDKIRSAV